MFPKPTTTYASFDLTRLRDVQNPPVEFDADTILEFGRAHNIVINEDSGYAYIMGTSSANGGPLFINIQNQLHPFLRVNLAMEIIHMMHK